MGSGYGKGQKGKLVLIPSVRSIVQTVLETEGEKLLALGFNPFSQVNRSNFGHKAKGRSNTSFRF